MDRYLSLEKEAYFPRLRREHYHITSEATTRYNCIAYAAGRDDLPWWPVEADAIFWPEGVEMAETLECFTNAYASERYTVCEGAEPEVGFEKIAIYVDASGEPTHAARQVSNGNWTSKLGDWEDIEHDTLELAPPRIPRAVDGLGLQRVESGAALQLQSDFRSAPACDERERDTFGTKKRRCCRINSDPFRRYLLSKVQETTG